MAGFDFPRDSFSTIPLTPNRRASSASTSDQGISLRPEQDQGVEEQVGDLVDQVLATQPAGLVGRLDYLGRPPR